MPELIKTCLTGQTKGNLSKMKTSRFDDLKKIHLLKTLAELGNLNKTAQAYKITTSAVSQSIKILEGNLGYPVIVKANDVWKVTEKGAQLLAQTEKIFQAFDETFAIDEQDALQLGSLAFGTFESAALDLMQDFSSKIRKDFPDVKLHFQISRSSELIKKIQSGELCSAIVAETDMMPESFLRQIIFTDTLGIYASEKLGFKQIADIKNCMIGTLTSTADGHPNYYKNYLKQFPEIKPNLMCDSFEVLRSFAEKAEAVVILPRRVALQSRVPLVELQTNADPLAGSHSIYLIASGTCDQKEFQYLSQVLLT